MQPTIDFGLVAHHKVRIQDRKCFREAGHEDMNELVHDKVRKQAYNPLHIHSLLIFYSHSYPRRWYDSNLLTRNIIYHIPLSLEGKEAKAAS